MDRAVLGAQAMTRQQYLKSKGWVKLKWNGPTNSYYWFHRNNDMLADDVDIAWEIQMEWQGDEYSWRPPQEIKTGRLKI